MHPTTADIVLYDLGKLGFETIKGKGKYPINYTTQWGERNRPIGHDSMCSMLFFIARKYQNKGSLNELKYQTGINQLRGELISDFFRFKEKLSTKKDVLQAVLEITKVMNEIQDTINFMWRLRTLRRTKDIRRAFSRLTSPKQYFYKNLRILFKKMKR
jgi:hypothetical protein